MPFYPPIAVPRNGLNTLIVAFSMAIVISTILMVFFHF